MTDKTAGKNPEEVVLGDSPGLYEEPRLEFVGNVRSILASGGSFPDFDGLEGSTGTMGS